ncbi:helix-turn-helix domain-containing protein [Salibacterium halotolerans]|uniref:AraC-type DNA-binding protein n=1 Tax=Salibacterium halotolerans TaxID=1884432 RepID=A0A1I5XLI0_9BACI|nr:AraC family transcriptional regulator [Salibacterium halotolerans]SFQ32831.1 AraC-type DNA-binding protein [Salibacterium halotolerans]
MHIKTSTKKPLEFISAGQFISSKPWTHEKRVIDSYELIIGVNDTLYMKQSDQKYNIEPGQAMLVLPDQIHEGFCPCTPGLSFYWVHFLSPSPVYHISNEEMDQEISRLRKNPDTQSAISDIYLPQYFHGAVSDRVNILFQQLLHIDNSNYYTSTSVHYLLTSLLIELSEQNITNFYYDLKDNQMDHHLVRIMEWTRVHAFEDITVGKVAEQFNYNKNYLSRLFKSKIGMNLSEYIHLLKISKAKELLTRTNNSVKEVAAALGIEDEKYFMKMFKKYENMTPTEFRKAFYRTHMNNT